MQRLTDSVGNGNGCLVFFPSYKIMTQCQKMWEDVPFGKKIRYEAKSADDMKLVQAAHVKDCRGLSN